MGRLGRLLSFLRTTRKDLPISDVKFDAGGGYNLTSEHFAPAGDDAHPLPSDFVAFLPIMATGRGVVVGYADPAAQQLAEPGEKRIYARDGDGVDVVHLWLKADGSAVLDNSVGSVTLGADGSIAGANGNGSFELEAAGNFVVNGVTIDTDGNITSPASVSAPSVIADGKELTDHDHDIASGSSAPGPTGTNNA